MIARYGGEVLPDPLEDFLGLFDTEECGGLAGREDLQVGAGEARVLSHVARSNKEDIAESGCDVLIPQNSFQLLERDGALSEGIVSIFVAGTGGGAPGLVIEEDTAAYDALFAPGAYAVDVGVWGVVDVGLEDAVVELRG